jgi:co-chaperonin GroES (HSP10)
MMNKMKPLDIVVLVELHDVNSVSKGGIHLPHQLHSSNKVLRTGTIKAMGENVTFPIQPGDEVMVKQHNGIHIEENLILIDQEDILVKMEK